MKEKGLGFGGAPVPKKLLALSRRDSLACRAVAPVAMRQRTCSSNSGLIMPLFNCAWHTAHILSGGVRCEGRVLLPTNT